VKDIAFGSFNELKKLKIVFTFIFIVATIQGTLEASKVPEPFFL